MYDPHAPERPRHRRRPALVLGGIVGGLVLLALVGEEASGIGRENRAYGARLAAAKALGLDPGFRGEIRRDAAKPEAARRAFDALEGMLAGRDLFAAGRVPPEEARAGLRRLAALARAAEGGRHRDWAKGADLLLPDLTRLREAANAAEPLVQASAARGDYAGATDILLDAADACRPFADEPILLTEFTRGAALKALFRAAGRLLADPAYPPAQAERLFVMADGLTFAPIVAPRALLATEITVDHDMLDHGVPPSVFEDYGARPTDPDLLYGMRLPRVRRAWQSDLLRLFVAGAPAMPEDPYDFDGAERAWKAIQSAAAAPRGLRGAFAPLVLPVFWGLPHNQRLREARRRVLRLAAGLRAGHPEASLRATPLELDPTDGRPLRTRASARGTVVYALGEDGRDHGGTAPASPKGTGDEVITLPRGR